MTGTGKYQFVNFTTRDGLLRANTFPIHRDPDGVMWFGTGGRWSMEDGGVSRYDGKELVKEVDSDISAQEMVDLIVQDVTEFSGGVELADDITVVVIKCNR